MEIWRDVVGYEGLYQVSNKGRVRSLDRIFEMRHKSNKMIKVFKKGVILKMHKCNSGYLKVTLFGKNYMVHRLVANAFIPNPDNLPCVNHKDENKTNNCVDNLEWCTHQYNVIYNDRHIKNGKLLRNRKDMSKIVYQYTLDGVLVNIFPSVSEAARQNNTSVASIVSCINGGFYLKGKWINKYQVKGFKYSYTKLS